MTVSGHGAASSTGLRRLNGLCRHDLMPPRSRVCRRVPLSRFFSRIHPRHISAGRIRMETPGATGQTRVWHVSRGFVFANDTKVVYPRLPASRYHSAPALSTADRDLSEPPPCQTLKESRSADNLTDSVAKIDKGSTPVVEDTDAPQVVPEAPDDVAAQEPAVKDPVEEEPPLTEPAPSDLEFKIPADLFKAAKNAPAGKPESFWSYSLYRGPNEDGTSDRKVKVHYCTSRHTTERVLKTYFLNEKVLGFDLEWDSNSSKHAGTRRNVSLVQLASPSRIALFHLAMYPKKDKLCVPLLKQIMEDPNITKVGVWIKGDSTRLRTYLGIDSRGIFELSHLYKLVKYSAANKHHLVDKRLVGLAKQVESCLGLPLFKGVDVRASNWSQPLGMDQLIYSASDAYAALQLFAALDYQRRNLDPTPPLPHHAELNLPIEYLVASPEEDLEQEPIEDPTAVTKDEEAAYTEYLGSIDGINVEAEDEDVTWLSTTVAETRPAPLPTTTKTKALVPIAEESQITAKVKSASTSTAKQTKTSSAQRDPRVAEADVWASKHRETGKSKTKHTMLRAYYLWHHNADLDVAAVAALLRDPPLAVTTLHTYITEAIQADGLPFDKKRLWRDILAELPEWMRGLRRFKTLVKICSEEMEEGEGEEVSKSTAADVSSPAVDTQLGTR
ncbi:putative Werner syndrome helicase [Echria macrotheca]|uniref:Werner syndrome helicase n=1 Tax=Echria macrotheca TaxID=438768 RepID=A0AAJ0BM80_9PEZI|nr:putative Werner syndrome helicase [Echria macrotheca]